MDNSLWAPIAVIVQSILALFGLYWAMTAPCRQVFINQSKSTDKTIQIVNVGQNPLTVKQVIYSLKPRLWGYFKDRPAEIHFYQGTELSTLQPGKPGDFGKDLDRIIWDSMDELNGSRTRGIGLLIFDRGGFPWLFTSNGEKYLVVSKRVICFKKICEVCLLPNH